MDRAEQGKIQVDIGLSAIQQSTVTKNKVPLCFQISSRSAGIGELN
jgi:hypothetical protein